MKTPEEIKKGMGSCSPENGFAPFYNDCSYKKKKWCADMGNVDALAYIRQIESNWKQVSKALCGKENATLEEVLRAVSQVKSELEAVKRERDAAVAGLKKAAELGKMCIGCIHVDCEIGEMCQQNDFDCWECYPGCVCKGCVNKSLWHWRGVCPENTEVQEDE